MCLAVHVLRAIYSLIHVNLIQAPPLATTMVFPPAVTTARIRWVTVPRPVTTRATLRGPTVLRRGIRVTELRRDTTARLPGMVLLPAIRLGTELRRRV